MATKSKQVKQATKPAAAPAQAPTPAPAAVPANKPVALRGGPAVQAVALTGKPYRTAAKHNQEWWATISAKPQQPVATLLEAKVPAHFIGYCLRRGYLQAAE